MDFPPFLFFIKRVFVMLISLGRGLSPVSGALKNTSSDLKILPSCVFDVDATIIGSYDPGGEAEKLRNLIEAPADGALQSDYDFEVYLSGVNFIQAQGDESAYFHATSQRDKFILARHENTHLTANLFRSDLAHSRPFTLAIAFRTPPLGGRVSVNIMGGDRHTVAPNWWFVRQPAAASLHFSHTGDDEELSSTTPYAALSPATDYVFIVTMNKEGEWHSWLNGELRSGIISLMTSTQPMPDPLSIFRGAAEGSRFYAASFFNEFIDNDGAEKIINAYQQRHNRAYAI